MLTTILLRDEGRRDDSLLHVQKTLGKSLCVKGSTLK